MSYISPYHTSFIKSFLDLVISLTALVFLFPLLALIFASLKFINHGPVFFIQQRVGKKGKIFNMIKFRTMKVGSDKLQNKYRSMNEADGPVFKIYNDPRLTPVGKILYQIGFDEIPQLINVLKGEMSIVGPRPLPVYEAKKLNKSQKIRETVKPGITSSWIVNGAHKIKFSEWMKLDKEYVKSANLLIDINIFLATIFLLLKSSITKLISK